MQASIRFSLNWAFSTDYYSSVNALTLIDGQLVILRLRGSYGREQIIARSLEFDCAETLGTITARLGNDVLTLTPGAFRSYQIPERAHDLILQSTIASDRITVTAYSARQLQWR